MHISTKRQLLLGVSKRKTLSQMVKKDRQDLRVCFNQAAYVLTSLRIELAHSRQTYFHNLSCMREVPLPQPLTGPRITAVSPTAFSCGRGAWGNSVALPHIHPFLAILSCFWQWLQIKCTTTAWTDYTKWCSGSSTHGGWCSEMLLEGRQRKERGKEFYKDTSDSKANIAFLSPKSS